MCVVCALKLVHNLIVLGCSLLSGADFRGSFQVEQIVCRHDGLQTMRDHDNRQLARLLLLNIQDGVLDFCLTLWVKCRSSLVKHQDLRLLNQGSGDSNSLFLTTREV